MKLIIAFLLVMLFTPSFSLASEIGVKDRSTLTEEEYAQMCHDHFNQFLLAANGELRNYVDCTRFSPLPLGKTVTFSLSSDDGSAYFDTAMRVEEVIRGDAAESIIEESFSSNEPLKPGKEYIMIKLVIGTYCENFSIRKSFSDDMFELCHNNGQISKFDEVLGIEFGGYNTTLTLMSGGNGDLWMAGIVDKDDASPELLFLETVWLSL